MRASRLLLMLLLVQNRGRMTSQDLAAELEVSKRTILRDVEALSEAGLPMIVRPGRGGGIELGFNYRTRLTGLATDEAEALGILLGRGAPSSPRSDLGIQLHGQPPRSSSRCPTRAAASRSALRPSSACDQPSCPKTSVCQRWPRPYAAGRSYASVRGDRTPAQCIRWGSRSGWAGGRSWTLSIPAHRSQSPSAGPSTSRFSSSPNRPPDTPRPPGVKKPVLTLGNATLGIPQSDRHSVTAPISIGTATAFWVGAVCHSSRGKRCADPLQWSWRAPGNSRMRRRRHWSTAGATAAMRRVPRRTGTHRDRQLRKFKLRRLTGTEGASRSTDPSPCSGIRRCRYPLRITALQGASSDRCHRVDLNALRAAEGGDLHCGPRGSGWLTSRC